MSKLIIVEGVDSTGKSSLAKFIARRLNACYHHASGHKSLFEGMWAHHLNILEAAKHNLSNGFNVVLDRHWPSEFAYGGILRPRFQEKYNFNEMIDRLKPLDPTYVYCHSPGGWHRYQETHRDHEPAQFYQLSHTDYLAIIYEYEHLFSDLTDRRIVKYSIEEHGADLHTFMVDSGLV